MAHEDAMVEKAADTAATAQDAAQTAASEAAGQAKDAAEHIQSSMDAASDGAAQTFDALAPAAAETSISKPEVLHNLSVNTVYLMGSSFILGVLFTVFILLVLDFMRRNAGGEEK